jgi:hypothetical protein
VVTLAVFEALCKVTPSFKVLQKRHETLIALALSVARKVSKVVSIFMIGSRLLE